MPHVKLKAVPQSGHDTPNQNLLGAALALTASAVLSLSDNFVAPVAEEAGLWQFQVFRSLFAVPLLLVFARVFNATIMPKSLLNVMMRSAAISFALLVYFATLGFLPVAQAGAGLFSAPIWVMLLSVLFFDKKIGRRRMIAMIGGFLAVLLLLRPSAGDLSLLSTLPLLAGALYALGALLTKFLCRQESALALALGVFFCMGTISTALLIYFTNLPDPANGSQFFSRGWEPITGRFLLLTFGQAVAAAFSVVVIAQAYRLGEPAFVSVCEYAFLAFAVFWAFVLVGSRPDGLTLVGIAALIAAGTLMFLWDQQAKQAR